jgi:predicted anti-sigma-YlaC factor YlaD
MIVKLQNNKTMNCKNTKGLMLQFLDGELSAEKTSEIKEHLMVCSDCSNELIKVKQLYGLIEVEKGEFLHNPYLSSKVLNRIMDHKEQESILLKPMRYTLIASLSAAAVFVGIVIGSFLSNVNSNIAQSYTDESIELLADEYFPTSSNNIYDIQIDETENNK